MNVVNKARSFSSVARGVSISCFMIQLAQLIKIVFHDTTDSSVGLWYFSHQVPPVSEGWQISVCGTPVLWYYQKDIVRYFESGSTAGYFSWCCAGWDGISRSRLYACFVAANIWSSLCSIYWQDTCGKEERGSWWCITYCSNVCSCCGSVSEGTLDFIAWAPGSCETLVQLYEAPKLSSNHFAYMPQRLTLFHILNNPSFKNCGFAITTHS